MNQITLRGFDAELQHHIKKIAEQENVSLNKAILMLLRRGAGLDETSPGPSAIADGLDDVFGSWKASEAAQFDQSTEVFEQVDEELWV